VNITIANEAKVLPARTQHEWDVAAMKDGYYVANLSHIGHESHIFPPRGCEPSAITAPAHYRARFNFLDEPGEVFPSGGVVECRLGRWWEPQEAAHVLDMLSKLWRSGLLVIITLVGN